MRMLTTARSCWLERVTMLELPVETRLQFRKMPQELVDGIPAFVERCDSTRDAAHRLGLGDRQVLQYGAAQGDGHFRRALAGFLARHHGVPTEMDQLLITAGASQALDLICTRLARPGDTIFVEEPSYFLALLIFRDHQLNVVGIPMDHQGLIIEALEESLRKHRPAVQDVGAFPPPAAAGIVNEH